jgi:hypothetical protein
MLNDQQRKSEGKDCSIGRLWVEVDGPIPHVAWMKTRSAGTSKPPSGISLI